VGNNMEGDRWSCDLAHFHHGGTHNPGVVSLHARQAACALLVLKNHIMCVCGGLRVDHTFIC
jgi:hypothetical protein